MSFHNTYGLDDDQSSNNSQDHVILSVPMGGDGEGDGSSLMDNRSPSSSTTPIIPTPLTTTHTTTHIEHALFINEYEKTLALASKASTYISKALDLIDNRNKQENIEWNRSNSEYCSKLVERFQAMDENNSGNNNQFDQNNVVELKSTIFTTWAQEVEEKYSSSSPETHTVMGNLRMAHQTLFGSEQGLLAFSPGANNSTLTSPRQDIITTSTANIYRGDDSDERENLFKQFGKGIQESKAQGIPKSVMIKKMLLKTFTIVDWVSTYKKEYLQNDISVGLSSGTMIIPQSMAYAFLAGLPPIYGLYTAFVPTIIYSLFGSSRHLAIGPLALMSIMVGAAVQALNPSTMAEYVGLANLLSLLVGFNFLIMCVLQLGFLINFLSRPVLSGFTSAAAIIIIMSQANFLFGIAGTNQQFAWKYAIHIVTNLVNTNWLACVLSVICFALLYIFKNYLKNIPKTTIPLPAPLILVTLGLLVSYIFNLEDKGIAVVGKIPSGLPIPTFFTNFNLDDAISLYKDSLVIPIVGLIETVSAAKVAANKFRYELSMNKELFGLGMANIVGCIFQSYPSCGAFGRTSLHMSSNAKTQLTSLISVVVVGLTLLFLTPIFYFLPKVVLASIVIFAVSQLVDIEEVKNLWRINKVDMFLLLVAFWATLMLGVQVGIATAVILSLVLVIYQSSKPNTYVCGRIPGTATYNDVALYPEAITENGVVVFRFDSPIIFVNAYYLRKQLKKIYMTEDEVKNPNVTAIVLDCSSVTAIDSTGVKYIKELIREFSDLKIIMAFADVRPNVLESLKTSSIYSDVGARYFFMRVHEAAKYCSSLAKSSHHEAN